MRFSSSLLVTPFLAASLLPVPGRAELVGDGGFEAVSETNSPWFYRGSQDGSHGVFSEPSRPGTYSFVLQLADQGTEGFSSIAQRVALEPGTRHRLRFEHFHPAAESSSPAGVDLYVLIDGDERLHLPIPRPERDQWFSRTVDFESADAAVLVEIGIRGNPENREDSTTALDNVDISPVETAPELAGRAPLVPGRRLFPVSQRDTLPVGGGFLRGGTAPNTAAALDAYRERKGSFPALWLLFQDWDSDFSGPAASETLDALQACADRGVLPVLSPLCSEERIREIAAGSRVSEIREWAGQLRAWSYPFLIRPWAQMDLMELEPASIIAAWSAVHHLFLLEDTQNAYWFWCPSQLSPETARFYPGDDQVDLVGYDHAAALRPEFLPPSYQYARGHYRNRAFAVIDSGGTPATGTEIAAIEAFLPVFRVRYPQVEFFLALEGLEEDPPDAFDRLVQTQLAAGNFTSRIPQISPAPLIATAVGLADALEVAVTRFEAGLALDPARMQVEFWTAPPAEGGTRVGPVQDLRLRPGEERVLRQVFPDGISEQSSVLVDPAADPAAYFWQVDSDLSYRRWFRPRLPGASSDDQSPSRPAGS